MGHRGHAAVEMVRAVRTDQRLDTVARLSHQGQRFHQYLTEEVIGAAPGWGQQLLRDLATFGGYPAHMVCATDATNTALVELSRVRGHWAKAQQYFERADRDHDELEAARRGLSGDGQHKHAAVPVGAAACQQIRSFRRGGSR
ncbi:MAG TPA: hypothetical protein VJ757_14065 [Pseudonocardiaceae bacterium]|nr:hypothetical protein [Pseudonocardiaceae bacterium]